MGRAAAADPPAAGDAAAKPATNSATSTDLDIQLRAYLKLQEQLHATLLAIEQGRLESSQSSLEARTNAETLTLRLEALEKSLAQQRDQQWLSAQDSHRTMLMFAAAAIGIGLLALAFTALFQSRGMNRLADIATGISQDRALHAPGPLPALSEGERLLLGNGAGVSAGRTLLATVERLQQRIHDLERTAAAELPLGDSPPLRSATPSPPADQLAALAGKAQVLLRLGQYEESLACYDQALHHDAGQPELHLKRGQLLEKLKRFDEAVASYDRAIHLNPSLTQAYLSKGGVLNQQERYPEALASYEEALRAETQPKTRRE